MARTKLVPKKLSLTPIDFTSARVAATKEIARKRKVHPKNVKIKNYYRRRNKSRSKKMGK